MALWKLEREEEWASLLILIQPPAMLFLPPPKPDLSPLAGYSLNKAISTPPFLVYTSAYNLLLLQTLHLITFWLCLENKKVELSTGYATLAKSYICQQIPNSIRKAILKS